MFIKSPASPRENLKKKKKGSVLELSLNILNLFFCISNDDLESKQTIKFPNNLV